MTRVFEASPWIRSFPKYHWYVIRSPVAVAVRVTVAPTDGALFETTKLLTFGLASVLTFKLPLT